MVFPYEKRVTLEEFYAMREEYDQVLEYIDSTVFMSPSPSTMHQRISGRLHAQFFNFLEGKECEVFHAPFDIELTDVAKGEKRIVVPDLSVICDNKGLDDNKYSGSSTLIVEILSRSNQSHDLVTKLNLYMLCGVQEYWIVNPQLNTVQIYTLDDTGRNYQQADIIKEKGLAKSTVLKGFEVEVERLFLTL